MALRSRNEILQDTLDTLEKKREERINKYIIPIEIKIEETKDKLREYWANKGIKV